MEADATEAGFVAAYLAQAGEPLRRLAGDGLEAGLTAFVGDPWGWQADLGFAERFHAALPAPGTTAADYLTRLLPVPGGTLLVGIRFRGGDLGFPFVEVLADHVPDVSIVPLVAAAYAAFRPRALRLWRLGADGPDLAAWPGASPDQVHWAGRASTLQARPRPARFDDLVVGPAESGYHPRLLAAYAAFHADRPDLARHVLPEDEDSLAQAAAAGLLLEARVEGEWAGLVAAMPAEDLGMRGWVVLEEALAPSFRGRGLGPALQRHLVERLPSDGVLFGTISAANAASTRTAMTIGRESVAASWWTFSV